MSKHSIADIANAMLLLTQLKPIVADGIIEYRMIEEVIDKSAASELLDPLNPDGVSDEELRLGRKLIQFKYEDFPQELRLKLRKRFFEHLKKADTPLHAMQKAIEQVSAKPLRVFFREN